MSRQSALSPTELLRLDQWAAPLAGMFPFGFGPYLVGSAMTRKTYRDVDVRQPVEADDALVIDPDRLRLVNVAMSVWAQQSTGLPVDFQFQTMTKFHEYDGRPRSPLGRRWGRATPLAADCIDQAVPDLHGVAKTPYFCRVLGHSDRHVRPDLLRCRRCGHETPLPWRLPPPAPAAADVQPTVDSPMEPTVDHVALRHVAAGGVLR